MEEQTNDNATSTNSNKPDQKLISQAFTFSQYINTIKTINSPQQFKLLKPLSTLSSLSEQMKSITPYHFRQLAIQFFYLLYSCWHLKIVPVPEDDQKFLCYSYENGNVCLCLNEFVFFDYSVIKQYQTMVPYFTYYKNFITAIHPFWKTVQQQGQKIKRQHLTADYFLGKLNELSSNTQLLHNERQTFSRFQKLQIFIETSILLRINRSALVCVIRKSQELMELYIKHRFIEEQLSQEYHQRRKRKNNVEKMLQTQNNIEKNIEDFFTSMIKNPQFYRVQDKRRKQSNASFSPNKLLLGLKVYQQSFQSTNSYDPDYFNAYEIQYQSIKNILIVRMTTDILLDWASSDSILFKWNTLTFETSNVGLETIEKVDQQNKLKKYIVVRGTSYFNRKQPVIQKILTLIDITMATYKSIELQMKSENFFNKNINKINQSYMKINHYLKAINKCCQKTYSDVMASHQKIVL